MSAIDEQVTAFQNSFWKLGIMNLSILSSNIN